MKTRDAARLIRSTWDNDKLTKIARAMGLETYEKAFEFNKKSMLIAAR